MSHQDSDGEHEFADPTPQQWELYERQVRDMLDAIDPGANAQHNVVINGDLSGTPRQVDVRVTGTLAGQQITIAVECKRYARPLGIGAVDEFAGKLLDLGVDRGVLFALNGLTQPARNRAKGAKVPKIAVGDLIMGPEHLRVDLNRLFTGFGDCPNENCYTGDIIWRWWRSASDGRMRAGSCGTCGTWAAECPECDEIVTFFWDTSECSCGASVSLVYDHKGIDVEQIHVQDEADVQIYELDEIAPGPD